MRKIAFAGLRHVHINGLFDRAKKSSELEIAAVCEEDPDARAAFIATHPGLAFPVYDSLDRMLAEVQCEIIATGDYYAKRGSILIAGLTAGKHVIADKPICTELRELDEIERLAREKKLCVGCMLDLRTNPTFVRAREMVLNGHTTFVNSTILFKIGLSYFWFS